MNLLKKKNAPNLDGLALLQMVKVGKRWIAIGAIGMVEVEESHRTEAGFCVVITWTTGKTITLTAEEWADFEAWLKDLHYQLAKQASAQQGGLIRPN